MKRIFAFLSITIAAMAPCACDFLEEENYTELSTETFFQDAKNVKYAVNGCYDILQKLAPQYVPCLETPTDYVCVSPDKKNAKETTWLNGVFTYSDERPSAVWEIAYMLIFNCNQVIDNIDAADLDDTLRERYIAEVRFLRGWSYLVLTNLFGDVPLRTTSKFGSSFSCELTPQSGIYDFLLEDLKYAEDHLYDFSYGRTLPDSKGLYKDNEHMRVSVDAALGMEALAYMYRAQNDAASPYWARARAKADSLITRYGGIDNAITGGWLSESYGSLFRGQTKYCRENLFSVYFDNGSKDDGSSLANNWAIYANYSKAANAGFRRFTNLWYQIGRAHV